MKKMLGILTLSTLLFLSATSVSSAQNQKNHPSNLIRATTPMSVQTQHPENGPPPFRARTTKTEYTNIAFKKLLSVFEHAYHIQKFHTHAINEKTLPGGIHDAILIFSMTNPIHPAREKAQISFRLDSSGQGNCTPCSVTRYTFSPGNSEEYTHEEWIEWHHQIYGADKKAMDEIKRTLGTSPAPLNLGVYWLD